jgi:NADH:ubiquinone oxidoreductase subunit 3 (subunit A)
VLADTLSTAHKLGLGLSALAFIIFALVSAMLIPHSRPDFPGRNVGWFVFVSILFFIGMMCAVVLFGE